MILMKLSVSRNGQSRGNEKLSGRQRTHKGNRKQAVSGHRAQVMYGSSPAWSPHVDMVPNCCSGEFGLMAGRDVVGVVCKKHSQMSEEKMVQ